MRKKLIIFFSLLFIIIISLLIASSGYEITNKNKHAEIPFFPETTKKNEFWNKRVDSMYVRSYKLLKKSNLLLVTYNKDTLDNNSTTIAIITKAFKPVFYLKTSDYLYQSWDEGRNYLFITQTTSDGFKEAIVFNIINRKREFVQELTENEYGRIGSQLKVIKHYTPNPNFTEAIFFANNDGKIYFAKKELATHISKALALKEEDNFNFTIPIIIAGDTVIHSKNIKLFDKTVTSNSLKRLMSFGTPSSKSSDGRKPIFDEDKGWFDKSRYYFFKIKLNKKEAQFKTDLFYNSDTYFDELSEPKTDQDTLLYYKKNRFYQFFKK